MVGARFGLKIAKILKTILKKKKNHNSKNILYHFSNESFD